MNGSPKYQIFPLIQKALTEGEWVDYNRESARVLYADILCATRDFDQAIAVLDAHPFVYSADAEYIRSKAYYNLGTEKSLDKARDKIDAARRIYPDDQRFAELFFRYEYALGGRNSKNEKIADSFINAVSLYKKTSVDIEIYAAVFAEGQKKLRMLKSFNARNLKSPLYAVASLEDGVNLLTEEKALDYFYSFADKSIDYSVLVRFAKSLKNPECIREFGEYLNQYGGIIYKDTDGDLTYNLKIEYNRGRPQKISYDMLQNDLEDWSCECDFGVPYVLHLTDGEMDIEYNNWPYISRAVYKGENNTDDYKLVLDLVAEELSWSPFVIIEDAELKSVLGMDFYFPVLLDNVNSVSEQSLLMASSSYTLPSKEKKGAYIKVSMLDGKAQLARYYVKEKMYAQTQFTNGFPVIRVVDMDGDGLFETTETYGYDSSKNQDYISQNDEIQIMTNLFGTGDSGTGFYVKMIQIDQNGDTIPDYTEEYTLGQGKISSWDLDNDGIWDVQYVKYPLAQDGSLIEEASFYQKISKNIVCVTTKNGIPYSVKEGEKTVNVIKAQNSDLYWIENAGSQEDAKIILKNVNQTTGQGVCTIVESGARRMLAVRVGKFIFAQILPSESFSLEKVED